jgi:hypothetical protein
MDNNILLEKFKRFEKNKENQETEQEKQQITTLPSFVSTCLTPNHSECTGSYEDTFHLFRMLCNCECHGMSSSSSKEAGN